ncbi:MAG TPA: protein kinase [Polyangiaceae bacterium]|jgi:serine/threonine-protein kinase
MDEDVARLAREERLLEAAELAASRGDARGASELFERACDWGRAADEAVRAGDPSRGLLLAVLGRDDPRAGALVARVAASASATEATHAVLERRGEAAWDARLLEAAGRAVEAARAWERAQEPVHAAELLERAGDVIGAARVLEASTRRDTGERAARLLALGDLLLRFGKTEAAVRALQQIPGDASERRRAATLLARAFAELGLARARLEIEAELATLGGPLEPGPLPEAASQRVRARLFGRYEVLREVASSASARVVECTDAVRGEHVAVKIFAGYDARGAGRDALARFEREVRALGRLDHPNVVPLRDYIADGPAIVLAWMSGGTLEPRIAEGSLTPARSVEVACALLVALGDAHRLGVLHRDVKPANVLFDDAGVARLADFGVAHLSDLSATATAGVIGTLAYMSPEQRDGRPATAQSDLFAVGSILFEMLTGQRPGDRRTGEGTLQTRPSAAHRDLDGRHDQVVLGMMAPAPNERPTDAFAARRALQALSWPTRIEPAAPRPTTRRESDSPQAGRAELQSDGRGFDRWIARPFEHVALDERSLARASAFARAGHPLLQTVLRVDREGARIWLEPILGRAPEGRLTREQIAGLSAALGALHGAGVAHGQVDLAHVLIDPLGRAHLRFTPTSEPTATADRDRLALARLG